MLTKEKLSEIKYINLVSHSHFTMPFGVGNIKAQVKKAMENQFAGFALTDSNMGGVLEAYKVCKDKKFPYALGVQLNIIDDLQRQDKVNKYFTITCFAKNLTGYKNLVTLMSIASTPDHFYYKPRISLPELIEHSEGLVVLSGDLNGMLSQSILRETGQEEILMQIFKDHFNEDFYVEIHFHNLSQQWDKDSKSYKDTGVDPQKTVNLKLIELARKYKVKCVLVQNSFMPEFKHKILQDILIGNTPIGKDGWRFSNTYNVMSVSEMYERVQKEASYISDEQFLEWTQNSILVLDKCKDIKITFTPKLPNIQYQESVVNQEPEWESKFQDLKKDLATRHAGLHDLFEVAEEDISLKTAFKIMMRNGKVDFQNAVHVDRLNEELRVIQRNGIIKLCDYFLLLEDVTHFVRSNGFLRGFGRGCLTGETKVLTPNGFNLLKDIKRGDKVYTHKGRIKQVVETFKYDVLESLLKVETQNSWGDISLTADHKVLGIKRKVLSQDPKRRKYESIEQVPPTFSPISEFKPGDLLFLKTPNYESKELGVIDLATLIVDETNYQVGNQSIKVLNPLTGTVSSSFNRYINPSDELVYLLGKWVGDGWYRYSEKTRQYDLGFAFNSADKEEIARTVKFFETLNFKVSQRKAKHQKLVQVMIYNKLLVKWFKSYFTNYQSSSRTKHLGDLKYLPKRQLLLLMKGLQSADGSISEGHYRQETFSTTSVQLVEDIKTSLMHLGIPSNITEREPYFRGQYLTNKSYTIKFIGLSSSRRARNYMVRDDGYFVKIKNISKIPAEPVYDLMIGGEPSYTTSNFTVHNSGAGSLVAYALDITDCDPIFFDLLFERFLTKDRIGKFNFEIPGFPFDEYSKKDKK